MTDHWFEGLHDVIADDLRFKAKLAIGEDAYLSSKLKKAVAGASHASGMAAVGAKVAGSAVVAQQFFAAPPLLAALGIGTAATPIGWVIAAGVVSGGAWFGVMRYLEGVGGKTHVVPEFINTPLDVIGLALFDLMCPLALKVAAVDGTTDPSELEAIKAYFIKQWGYDADFVEAGVAFVSANLEGHDVKVVAKALADFARENPDCKPDAMLADLTGLLREIMEADGIIDEREQEVIEQIEQAFAKEMSFSLSRTIAPVGSAVSGAAEATASAASSAASSAGAAVSSLGQAASSAFSGALTVGAGLFGRPRALGGDTEAPPALEKPKQDRGE